MLSSKIFFSFSKNSSRHTVPRVLAQGRFTRKGFKIQGTGDPTSKNFVERRYSRVRRAVNLTGVPNAHLYYDHQKSKEEHLQYQQNIKEARLQLLKNAPPVEDILANLQNQEYLQRGNWQLLWNLKLLKIHYPQEITDKIALVRVALNRLNCYLQYLDIYNFKTLTKDFALNCLDDTKDLWKLYLQNLIRLITSYDQNLKPFLSASCSEDERKTFLALFNRIVTKALQHNLNLDNLIIQLDFMMRNHHRFENHGEETKNKVENLKDVNLAGIFFSLFSRVISQRRDFYNEYDENKKKQQVKDFLNGFKDQLKKETKSFMKKNLKEINDQSYIVNEIQQIL